MFYCARCRRQTFVCNRCDFGRIYCSAECAQLSRAESCREAGKRYQKTPRGASNHAERQRRQREREREEPGRQREQPAAESEGVTHQGLEGPLPDPKEEAKDVEVEGLETTAEVAVEPLDLGSEDVSQDASDMDGIDEPGPGESASLDGAYCEPPEGTRVSLHRCTFCGRVGVLFTRLDFFRRR